MEDEKKIRNVMQVAITHLPCQLRDRGVSPQYFRYERIKVRKGIHALALWNIIRCAKLTSKLGSEGSLHIWVTRKLNKDPLRMPF